MNTNENRSKKISTWRERIGQAADFPLHVPTDVERVMVAEIADGQARIGNLEAALRYYAEGNHFVLADPDAWDTVSGEPVNFQCDEAGTATVEDGTLAKMVLAGESMPHDEDEIPVTPKVQSEALDEAPIQCWSADQEDFNATELGSVLTAHEELKPGDTVWVGEAVKPEPAQLIDADDIMTTMGERAYDIAGDHADDYPDVSKDAEQELNTLLAAWIGKHASPSFWTVANIRPYVLRHDDFPNDPTPVQCDVPAPDHPPDTPSGALVADMTARRVEGGAA